LCVLSAADTLIENMKNVPFSLSVDESNDTGLEKLYPLTVKIYDVTQRHVRTQILEMCTTTGRECGTTSTKYNKIDFVIKKNLNIPWENCARFGSV